MCMMGNNATVSLVLLYFYQLMLSGKDISCCPCLVERGLGDLVFRQFRTSPGHDINCC